MAGIPPTDAALPGQNPAPLGAGGTVSGPAFHLAIDAMGGDRGADMVVRGLDIAAERHPSARFLLVGDQETLRPLLAQNKRAQRSRP